MIDWGRVDELRREIGDEDFAEIVQLFMSEVDDVLKRVLAGQHPGRLASDLHFLKGSALNLGFAAFGAECSRCEKLAASGRSDAIDLHGLVDTCHRSSEAFLAQGRPC